MTQVNPSFLNELPDFDRADIDGWMDILHRNETYYRSLFHHSPMMYYVADAKGDIVSVNQFGASQLGYTTSALLNQPILAIYHAQDRPTAARHLRNALQSNGQQVYSFESRHIHQKGYALWVREHIRSFSTHTGEVLLLVAAHDISDEKVDSLQLEKQARELARSNDELSQFAMAASHDLRQPLRVIMGAIQLLEKRYGAHFSPEDSELVALACGSIQTMNQRIQDLFEYTNIRPEPCNRQLVSLNKLVEQIMIQIEQETDCSHINVVANLPAVRIAEAHATVLFRHLLSNAVKFGGKNISLTARKTEHGYEFAISDDGIGIEPQYFHQIFGIFKRLHNATQYEGTGIGLATCKKIVNIYDGIIWVESEYGKGSTFKFNLPDC